MKLKRKISFLSPVGLVGLFFVFVIGPTGAQEALTSFVNPFIGTGGHGHTFPGAVMPFGMVQLSPDTRVDGSWDGCSGYHYSDSKVYGFSHTHLSGTGCSDWGDILLMPFTGKATVNNKEYAVPFQHRNERAEPGFYSLVLDRMEVELTVTPRVGIHRYTYHRGAERKVLIDLLHRDKTLDCNLQLVDSVTVTGYRISEAWARRQVVYFAIRFSEPVSEILVANQGKLFHALDADARREGACIKFRNNKNSLTVKVALSAVDEAGALNNMDQEARHWNFDDYKKAAITAWEKQLSGIQIQESNRDRKTVFYSALYHCFIHPSLNMDIDGKYRGRDDKIHRATGFTNYNVFSLWDTYRALHPLFTILDPARDADFISSFLVQYEQGGRLPMWELSSNETDCMIGFHSVSAIADAYVKGIRNFDTQLALKAMIDASNHKNYNIPKFNQQGFLQVDDESESVSKSLEYAYDNWCVAKMAGAMGDRAGEEIGLRRSLAYRHLFDKETGNMRPRKNGNWLSPFYPEEINNHFTEGNSWQYSFYVPHDVDGLIALHGGRQNFEKKLDALFTASTKTRGREQADVTGLIGQYAHGNEPSHHMTYLYQYTDHPEKTNLYVNKICDEFYTNAPDGLIGNEDCGQMSAWYIFSTMGFYPVCPGSGEYIFGSPQVKELKLRLDQNKTLTIRSDPSNRGRLAGVLLNGKALYLRSFTHQQLLEGGEMSFDAASPYARTVTLYIDPQLVRCKKELVPAPLIQTPTRSFRDKMTVTLESMDSTAKTIYYTTNGTEPDKNSLQYKGPFEIDNTVEVKARAMTEGGQSSVVTTAKYFKIKYPYKVKVSPNTNPQYSAEGPQSLIDGIYGSGDWRKGDWLGIQGQDVQIDVDLIGETTSSGFLLSCLQDSRSWILFPKEVQVQVSIDGTNFKTIESVTCPVKADDLDIKTYAFKVKLKEKEKARYLRFVLKNPGKLPEWHQGAGGESFIFTDELEIFE